MVRRLRLRPDGQKRLPDQATDHDVLGSAIDSGPVNNQYVTVVYPGAGRFVDVVVDFPSPPNSSAESALADAIEQSLPSTVRSTDWETIDSIR